MSLIDKIFGTHSEREVKRVEPIVDKIMSLRDEMVSLVPEDADFEEQKRVFSGKTEEFKARLKAGETLDDILPEAYALVREAARRILHTEHYRVQLIGGIILHQGRIAEMRTGEGKTQTCLLPAYLNALEGKGVHVVTVNDYLAKRDAEWMGQVHTFLGLTVGVVLNSMEPDERRAAYNCDITYITNNELGFDYLRDNMVIYKNQLVQRGLNYAIVDEVDSVLIDEARTPLIISGQSGKSTRLYELCDVLARQLVKGEEKELSKMELLMKEEATESGDFVINEKEKTVNLTEEGVAKVEKFFHIDNLADADNLDIQHNIILALRAHYLMFRDQDYVVKDDQVLIVDEFTGRIMPGRRYSDGLHQAIEAKEHVKVKRESRTLATITFQNFFNKYTKKAGMTGTALTEEQEFREIYGMDVVEIPTNKPVARIDYNDAVYKTKKEKYNAVVREIEEAHKKGQPVLVGTITIEQSEIVSALLSKKGIPHKVLNAKFHELEAEIVAEAGVHGAVTIATNMAGRGTDIQLGGNPEVALKKRLNGNETPEEISKLKEEIKTEIAEQKEKVLKAGGLYILGTERHESRRIDNQLRGRSGRQGDPGTSKFFLSLEDDLMRIFGSERMSEVLRRLGLPEGEALVHPFISKALEKAQQKVEERNFDIRKSLLKYDDVMNEQRKVIYEQRKELMSTDDISDTILDMRHDYLSALIGNSVPEGTAPDEWDIPRLKQDLFNITGINLPVEEWAEKNGIDSVDMVEMITKEVDSQIAAKNAAIPESIIRLVEKSIMLQTLDQLWKDHIATLDLMRHTIVLRAYGQKDPLNEYKREAFNMFSDMLDVLKERVTTIICRTTIQQGSDQDVKEQEQRRQNLKMEAVHESPDGRPQPVAPENRTVSPSTATEHPEWKNISRNSPCPCGSGKKYKKCCGKIAE